MQSMVSDMRLGRAWGSHDDPPVGCRKPIFRGTTKTGRCQFLWNAPRDRDCSLKLSQKASRICETARFWVVGSSTISDSRIHWPKQTKHFRAVPEKRPKPERPTTSIQSTELCDA